jgi:hypothetical protein
MRSQFVTASKRNIRHLPFAFTEHGAIMGATILKSPQAVQMSVFVVRAFVKMRTAFTSTRDLARKLAALEKELTARLDTHESAIVGVLQRIVGSPLAGAAWARASALTYDGRFPRARVPRLPVAA